MICFSLVVSLLWLNAGRSMWVYFLELLYTHVIIGIMIKLLEQSEEQTTKEWNNFKNLFWCMSGSLYLCFESGSGERAYHALRRVLQSWFYVSGKFWNMFLCDKYYATFGFKVQCRYLGKCSFWIMDWYVIESVIFTQSIQPCKSPTFILFLCNKYVKHTSLSYLVVPMLYVQMFITDLCTTGSYCSLS